LLSAEAQFKKSDSEVPSRDISNTWMEKTMRTRSFVPGWICRLFHWTGQTGIEYFKSSASDKDSVGFYSSYYLGLLYLKQQQKPLA